MHKTITSRSHRVVKGVRRLRKSAYRDSACSFLLEGSRLLREAIDSGANLRELFFVQSMEEEAKLIAGRDDSVDIYEVSEDLMRWLSDVVTPQGILGVVEQVDVGFRDLLEEGVSLLLVADQVRDPGNMGALIRLADAAAFDGCVLSTGCADLYNPKVVRAAAGSHFHVPLARRVEFGTLAGELRESGMKVMGMDPRGSIEYTDFDFTAPVALTVGNEASGIAESQKDYLDDTVYIDMPGRAESLNVASAAAVVAFECLRQRKSAHRE